MTCAAKTSNSDVSVRWGAIEKAPQSKEVGSVGCDLESELNSRHVPEGAGDRQRLLVAAARRPLPAARCRAASMAHNPDG